MFVYYALEKISQKRGSRWYLAHEIITDADIQQSYQLFLYCYLDVWGFFSFSVFNLAFHVHVLASQGDSKLPKSFTDPVYFLTPDLMQCFLQCLSTK